MKVAIPSNDLVNIFKRTGRTEKFVIAEIINSEFSIVNTVLNKHNHDHDEDNHAHDHGHSHDDLFESIAGCSYVIVNVVGKQLKADMEINNIGIFKTKETNVEAGILDFISKKI